MSINLRALAAKCCYAVVDQGRSLSEELPKHQEKLAIKDQGLLQEICYGVLRYLPELEHNVRQFIDKPLKGKQRVFHFLLLAGVYQIKYTRIPDHAAVSETVAATGPLRNKHLKGLVNAVLRNYQRATENADEANEQAVAEPIKYNHPSWFIKRLQQAYPDSWQQILAANLERPPMWLRVNQQHYSSAQYQSLLTSANIEIDNVDQASGAIDLVSATNVNNLPGFTDGHVSIQDGAAQQSARLLDCQPEDNVLDCCAAPGGKTCHIIELQPKISSITAIDIDAKRLARVQENLDRLKLSAKLVAADASAPADWHQGQLFDRILLDAPCSATGVIRRHPDIKWLRKDQDIANLVKLQRDILKNMWSLLKPGGTLLYATCSVLPDENCLQIKQFLAEQPDASLVDLPEYGTANAQSSIGWQILPGENNMDGFYYAKLQKAN
ncbi:MAG: 16S rRNA (cytosine(967)-C(5))-methyltransferase RsmB [Cognaticolwellia aestuarii]